MTTNLLLHAPRGHVHVLALDRLVVVGLLEDLDGFAQVELEQLDKLGVRVSVDERVEEVGRELLVAVVVVCGGNSGCRCVVVGVVGHGGGGGFGVAV